MSSSSPPPPPPPPLAQHFPSPLPAQQQRPHQPHQHHQHRHHQAPPSYSAPGLSRYVPAPDMARVQQPPYWQPSTNVYFPDPDTSHSIRLPPLQTGQLSHPWTSTTGPMPHLRPPNFGTLQDPRDRSNARASRERLRITDLVSTDPPSPHRRQSDARPSSSPRFTPAHPPHPPLLATPLPSMQPPQHQYAPAETLWHKRFQSPPPSSIYQRPQRPITFSAGPDEPFTSRRPSLDRPPDPRASASLSSSFSPSTSCSASHSDYSPYAVAISPAAVPTIISRPPASLDFALIIRQQPFAARACGLGDRDRRAIDPPPIIELKITRKDDGSPARDLTGQSTVHCTIEDPETGEDVTLLPRDQADGRALSRLPGSLAASPYEAKDEHGVPATFFIFHDLSCRTPGKFRLRFKFIRIDPMFLQEGAQHPTVTSVATNIFTSYAAKDFPGMRASSPLLKALRDQGFSVGIKKGSEARKVKSKARKEGPGSTSESEDVSEKEEGDDEGREASERKDHQPTVNDGKAESPGTKRKSIKSGRKRRRHS